jgi:threonylcarbamoyladenosine tRNA methylthiotransferase MtaB
MRVYLHTFGCKANQYDTEVVRQALEMAGASRAVDLAAADAAVINTCTVTHVAEAKMRGLVRRWARLQPGRPVVLMGCAAARDAARLAQLPGVGAVVAGSDPQEVLSSLGLASAGGATLLRSFARGSRAWLKIQDGCDEHCTFCATTLARGPNRSRPPEELVREAGLLAEQHQEIVLTGVHIGTYGQDREGGWTLGRLVETLVQRVPRVRFRLSSVEATEVDQRLAELMMAAPDRLAPHLHAPLQSGSDRVLKRMGRHWYTASSYRRRIEWLASRLPSLGLGADVMVGFPGEGESDFRATMELVRALPFTYLHVFPYSERPGVAARRLGRPVEPKEVAARSRELRQLAAAQKAAYEARRDGGLADVVLLEHRVGRFEGLTEDYLTVYLPTAGASAPRLAARLRRQGGLMIAEAA